MVKVWGLQPFWRILTKWDGVEPKETWLIKHHLWYFDISKKKINGSGVKESQLWNKEAKMTVQTTS